MPLPQALAIVAGVIAVALLIGALWRRGQGRTRAASGASIAAADIGATALGERLTLLLLTTRTCGRCPAARRVIDGSLTTGERRLDVDLEAYPAIARRFDVLQTPTTIVLDRDGAPRARIAGVPDPRTLREQLDRILEHA